MMIRFSLYLVALAVLVVMVLSCGENSQDEVSQGLISYFPDQVEGSTLKKTSDTRTFVGDSLWEYINGGAELYHSFGFVKVSTADYKNDEAELVLDYYEFETSEGAYGMYLALRPDELKVVDLGVEGYLTSSSLEFVKGEVLVKLKGFDASEATVNALHSLSAQIAINLPGTTEPPHTFDLFPEEQAVEQSDRIVGEAFLGQSFLNMVYTRDISLDTETATLFLLDDAGGEAMVQWFELVSEEERSPASLVALPFDDNYYLLTANSYYGDILAGLKNGKLVGVVNYSDQLQKYVADWLNSLPSAN